ncbi:MAG TPA: phosphoribosyltransferase family protein [Dehalococcoidia bacterium]|nr:phosphoribosyltransferase family protein [Dehalococcoidia bacterium]
MTSRGNHRVPNLWLAKTLWEVGGVRFGDFTLGKTTVHSPVYVNPRRLVSKPTALARAARVMDEEVRALMAMRNPPIQPFDLVAGIPFGGLHLATAFSLRTRTPLIYLQPRPGHPGEQVVEGMYSPGQRVLLIDDLVNKGGSILRTANALEEAGLEVRNAVVLIDRQVGARERLRERGYDVFCILGLEALLNYLMSTAEIEESVYRKSLSYLEQQRDHE